MAPKTLVAQRDELIEIQLQNINTSLERLERAIGIVTVDLGTVRLAEMQALRDRQGALEGDMKVLNYQSKRSGAWGGLFAGAAVSAIVAALAAILFHH